MIENVYKEKIEALKAEELRLVYKSRLYLYGKLLSFVALLFFAFLYYKYTGAENVAFILVSGFLYLISYMADDRCRERIDSICRMRSVCENEISYLGGDFTPFDTGEEYIDHQHEYSFDLDIFGRNSLFNRLNRTITRSGKERLAKKLTRLSVDKGEIENNQLAISELASMSDWRIRFLAHPSVESNLKTLSEYITHQKSTNALRIKMFIPYISIPLTILLLLSGIIGILPWAYFSTMFFLQILLTVIVSRASSQTSIYTDKLHKEYKGYLTILRDIQDADFHSDSLRKLKQDLFETEANSMEAFHKLSRMLNLFEQRGSAIMYIILNGLFLWDIVLVRMFMKWADKYLPHVERWIACIGEFDALVSLSTYAYNNPQNHPAKVLDNDSEIIIRATNVYHPFLNHDKAVANDFLLKKKQVAIITGANMAGKSTFLRTIGVTYILAANGVPVCAQSFEFSIVSLFSSMRTTDDLSHNISYFNAELIRLKQLVQYVKSNHCTLIILDEILKGTNSKDKLKGSVMFLRELAKYNMATVVATHDLELAKLEEDDNCIYSNYRFEIELSEEITYSYKIQEGVAQNLNASYLLENILRSLQ